MTRARLVDVPALAWVLGYAQTYEPLGRRAGKIVATLAWPLWAVILAALVTSRAGLWHRDRVVMAVVTPPSTHSRPPAVAALIPLAVGALMGAVWTAAPWVAGVVATSAAAALVSVAAPVPGRLRAGPAAPGAAIRVQFAAALPGAPRGALVDIARLVRDQHSAEVPVEVCARDAARARIYERWGLRPVTPGFGRMRSVPSSSA